MLDGFCLCWQGSNLVTEQICTLEKTLLTTGCSQLYKECTDTCQQPAAAVSVCTSCCSSAMHGMFISDSQPTPAWHGGVQSFAPESYRGAQNSPLCREAFDWVSRSLEGWGQSRRVMIKLMFTPVSLCMWRSITAGTASNAAVLVLSPRLLKYGCLSIRERCKCRKAENSLWAIWKQLMNYHS